MKTSWQETSMGFNPWNRVLLPGFSMGSMVPTWSEALIAWLCGISRDGKTGRRFRHG